MADGDTAEGRTHNTCNSRRDATRQAKDDLCRVANTGDDVALFARRAGILLRMADKAEAEGRFEDAGVHFNRGQEYLMKSRRAVKLDYANRMAWPSRY